MEELDDDPPEEFSVFAPWTWQPWRWELKTLGKISIAFLAGGRFPAFCTALVSALAYLADAVCDVRVHLVATSPPGFF